MSAVRLCDRCGRIYAPSGRVVELCRSCKRWIVALEIAIAISFVAVWWLCWWAGR